MSSIYGARWHAEIRTDHARVVPIEPDGAGIDPAEEINRTERGLAIYGPDKEQQCALLTAGEALELLHFLQQNEDLLTRLSRDDATVLYLTEQARQRFRNREESETE